MAKFIVEEISPIERRIRVEVDAEVVSRAIDRTYGEFSRQAKIPGFRPGKVPRRILEARFRAQAESEAIQRLVEESYREAILAHPEVEPVSQPRVTNEGLKPGEPFRYAAEVEVKPKVEARVYEGLDLAASDPETPPARIDEEIEKMRQALANFVPVSGRTEARPGDFAVIRFQGARDGRPVPGAKGEDVTMEVAPGEFADGHAGFLAGCEVGASRELDYTFPAGYRVKELAGQTLKFSVRLDALKSREVSELNDAMAVQLGADGLEDLKERVRTQMVSREADKARRAEREQLVAQLVEKNPFDVPRGLVDRRLNHMLDKMMDDLAAQGIDPSKLRLDLDRLRESMRASAVTQVKGALLLEAISEKEKIQAGDEDLEARLTEIAGRARAPVERLRAHLRGEAEQALRMAIREDKTLAFLKAKAKIARS